MQSVTLPRSSSADLPTALRRIEERLDQIERTLAPLETLSREAPKLLATLGDIGDEWARRLGDTDARVTALSEMAERLTRPQTLETLTHLVDLAEAAPQIVATLGDVFDETMSEAADQGLELTRLADDSKRLAIGLLKLTTSPELRALLDSGMLDPRALYTLGSAARAVADANEVEPPRVGLLGAMRALRDQDTQRALGFVLRVAESFGRALRRESKQLTG